MTNVIITMIGLTALSELSKGVKGLFDLHAIMSTAYRLIMEAFRCLFLTSLLSSCLATKYVMFPMFSRSHYLVIAKLGEELAARGHEVTYNKHLQ